MAKLKGQFNWHFHKDEDELFLIVKSSLLLKFRYKDIILNEDEFIVVPKGVEHLPIAEEEVQVIFIEPKSTLNTGNVHNERAVEDLEKI